MGRPGMGIGSRECEDVVDVYEVAREFEGRLAASKEEREGMRTEEDGRWISMVNAEQRTWMLSIFGTSSFTALR